MIDKNKSIKYIDKLMEYEYKKTFSHEVVEIWINSLQILRNRVKRTKIFTSLRCPCNIAGYDFFGDCLLDDDEKNEMLYEVGYSQEEIWDRSYEDTCSVGCGDCPRSKIYQKIIIDIPVFSKLSEKKMKIVEEIITYFIFQLEVLRDKICS